MFFRTTPTVISLGMTVISTSPWCIKSRKDCLFIRDSTFLAPNFFANNDDITFASSLSVTEQNISTESMPSSMRKS